MDVKSPARMPRAKGLDIDVLVNIPDHRELERQRLTELISQTLGVYESLTEAGVPPEQAALLADVVLDRFDDGTRAH